MPSTPDMGIPCLLSEHLMEKSLFIMKFNAYRLQIRLVLSLLIFTMIMTAVVTSLEMVNQYRQGIADLYHTFDRIRDAHGSTLTQNLWRFDERSIEIQMKSIVNEGAVIGATLTDDIKGVRRMGDMETTGSLITVSYPLMGDVAGKALGTLTLYGTDAMLRDQMIRQIPQTILSELTKIVTASLFLLVLFYMLFGRHLNRIIAYTDSLSIKNLDKKLSLNRRDKTGYPDELDRLTGAINHMADRIQADFEERQASEQLIAQKNRELEQIVYVTSHDLRSPLVNVDGYSRELELSLGEIARAIEGPDTPSSPAERMLRSEMPDMKNALQFIRSSIRQMDKMLKGLLKLSRSGRESLTMETINANPLVERVLVTFDYQFKALGVKVILEPLPSCVADDMQLSQIFSNLIANALKYRDPSRSLTIRITGTENENHVTYCVEDSGIGIAPEHQEKIFELFHRLNPAANDGEGLGLTIVRQSLWRMDGVIRVESRPGEGSRFYITLPSVSRRVQRALDSDWKGALKNES